MRLSVFFQFSPQERIPVGTLSDYGRETLSVSGIGENPTQAALDRLAKEVGL